MSFTRPTSNLSRPNVTSDAVGSGGSLVELYDSGVQTSGTSLDSGTLPAATKNHLLVVYECRSDVGSVSDRLHLKLNDDSVDGNYDGAAYVGFEADPVTGYTISDRAIGAAVGSTGTANSLGYGELRVIDYTQSARKHAVKAKNWDNRGGAFSGVQEDVNLEWSTLAAITRVGLFWLPVISHTAGCGSTSTEPLRRHRNGRS
jgi:hypothetical protein